MDMTGKKRILAFSAVLLAVVQLGAIVCSCSRSGASGVGEEDYSDIKAVLEKAESLSRTKEALDYLNRAYETTQNSRIGKAMRELELSQWKVTKVIEDDGSGKNLSEEYLYDENGNRISELWYDCDGELWSTIESEFDEYGHETVYVLYDCEGNEEYRGEYTYDADGRIVREIDYLADGSFDCKFEYEYDENGNLVIKRWYNMDENKILFQDAFSYDAEGNVVLEVRSYSDGSLEYECRSEYDADGNRLFSVYDYGNYTNRIDYTYDKKGNMISEVSGNSKGIVEKKTEYAYDTNGNKISVTYFDGDGNRTYQYEYEYAFFPLP